MNLYIYPDTSTGHYFQWSPYDPSHIYTVEWSDTLAGPWQPYSEPTTADHTTAFKLDTVRDYNRYFRVTDGQTASTPRSYFADLPRREFLLVKEMQRKEVLALRTLSGSPLTVYQRTHIGKACECKDPVTGDIRDPQCAVCNGTGKLDAYSKIEDRWGSFSAVKHSEENQQDADVTDTQKHQLNMVSVPVQRHGDVVKDNGTGKYYEVSQVQQGTELRRVPVVQTAVVNEITNTKRVPKC